MMIDFNYPEGATPIDLNEAGGLLLTHITTQGDLDRWEHDNIVEALAWIEKTKPTDILNEQFIKKLHKRMFGNVWKWAGQFRQSDKNMVYHGLRFRQVSRACAMMSPYGLTPKMNPVRNWLSVFITDWCGSILSLTETDAMHVSWQTFFLRMS